MGIMDAVLNNAALKPPIALPVSALKVVQDKGTKGPVPVTVEHNVAPMQPTAIAPDGTVVTNSRTSGLQPPLGTIEMKDVQNAHDTLKIDTLSTVVVDGIQAMTNPLNKNSRQIDTAGGDLVVKFSKEDLQRLKVTKLPDGRTQLSIGDRTMTTKSKVQIAQVAVGVIVSTVPAEIAIAEMEKLPVSLVPNLTEILGGGPGNPSLPIPPVLPSLKSVPPIVAAPTPAAPEVIPPPREVAPKAPPAPTVAPKAPEPVAPSGPPKTTEEMMFGTEPGMGPKYTGPASRTTFSRPTDPKPTVPPATGATPANPAPPATGATPANPVPPATGATPANPVPPATGATPANPVPPATGAKPATPANPAPPATGATPANPAPPATGAKPATPANPVPPATGVKPVAPAPRPVTPPVTAPALSDSFKAAMAIMTTVVKGGADAWGKLTEENKKVIATAAKENMPLFEDLLKKSGINPELATKILTEIKGRVANMSTAPAPAKDAEFKLTTKNSPVTADGKTTIKTTYEVQVGDGKPPVKLMFDPKTKELKSEDPSISVSKDDKGKITITKMPLAPMTIDNAKLQAEVDKLEAARGAAPAGPATPAPAAPAPEKPAAGMPLAEIEKELAAEMTKMQTAKTALDTSKKALQDALAAKPPVEANITKALDEYETKVKASKDPMTKSTKRVNELATEGEKVAAEPKKAAFGMVKAQTANANPMSEYETLLDEERKKRPKGAAPDAPAAGVGGGDNWFKKLFDVIGAIVSGDMKRVEDILRGGPAAAAPAPAAPGAGTPPAGAKPADPAKPAAPGTSAVTRTAASQGIPDDQLEAIEIAELTSQRLQVENPTMEPAKAAEQGKAAGQEAMKDAALLEATGEGQGKKFLADKVEEAKASLEAAKAKAPPAPVKPVEPEKPKMPKVVFREGKDGKVDRATIVKLNKRLLVDAKTKVALENPDLKPNSPEFNAKVMETWKSVAEEVIREAAKGGTTVTVADVAKGAENRLALMEAEIDLRKALTARENAKDSVRTPEAIKAVVDKEVKETMEKARMGEGLTGTPAIDYVKTDTNKAVSETAKLETDKAFAEMNSTPEKKALLDAYRESIVKVAKANPLITDPEAFADRAVQMTVKDLAKMTPDQVKATVTKNEQKAVEIKAKVEAKMNSPEIQADRAKIVEDAGKRDVGAVVQDTAKLTSDMGAAMDAVKKMMADGDFKFAVASKDGGKEISMKDVGGLSAPVAGGGGAPEPTAER